MRAREVMVLMTGIAFDRIYSLAVGPASDLHCVLMAVVSLTRKISGGMTIHASWMAQYRYNRLKSSGRVVARRCRLRSGIERQQEGGQCV